MEWACLRVRQPRPHKRPMRRSARRRSRNLTEDYSQLLPRLKEHCRSDEVPPLVFRGAPTGRRCRFGNLRVTASPAPTPELLWSMRLKLKMALLVHDCRQLQRWLHAWRRSPMAARAAGLSALLAQDRAAEARRAAAKCKPTARARRHSFRCLPTTQVQPRSGRKGRLTQPDAQAQGPHCRGRS